MEPAVTILTPTDLKPDRLHWLTQAHESLHENEATFQHVIVVDGVDPSHLPVSVFACPTVTVITLPTRSGAAAARNIGLAHAESRYVTSLDDDDLLPPHSLDIRLDALTTHSWVAGLLTHLHVDGTEKVWHQPAQPRIYPAGEVMNAWGSAADTVPIGPTTIMTTRELMRALGGWVGLPTGEDLALMAAITAVASGVVLDRVVYQYRSHPEQSLKVSPNLSLEPVVRDVAFQRAAALAQTNHMSF